jgi:hypothetical protein
LQRCFAADLQPFVDGHVTCDAVIDLAGFGDVAPDVGLRSADEARASQLEIQGLAVICPRSSRPEVGSSDSSLDL